MKAGTNSRMRKFVSFVLWVLLLSLDSQYALAKPNIAVLDFELKDLTLKPGTPQEVERTASVKPLLVDELKKLGFDVVEIPVVHQLEATAGIGYLYDHHDTAAQLAVKYNADYVIVGRLHKPSFLFVYLLAQLIDVKQQRMIADYSSEVKGGEKKLTLKGVESLAVKINDTLKASK